MEEDLSDGQGLCLQRNSEAERQMVSFSKSHFQVRTENGINQYTEKKMVVIRYDEKMVVTSVLVTYDFIFI